MSLRYNPPGCQSFRERLDRGADHLAETAQTPGWAFLLDVLEAEMRAYWRAFMDPEIPDEKCVVWRQKAIWLSSLVEDIQQKAGESDWRKNVERLYADMNLDLDMAEEAMKDQQEALRESTQTYE